MTNYLARILITGGQGQLAHALTHHKKGLSYELINCGRHELDITQLASVTQALQKYRPDIVINTAAYTAVDQAESHVLQAMAANKTGAYHVASLCDSLQIPLIHVSTDYIFDGQKKLSYCENDVIRPINIYGQSKYLGEEAIRTHCRQHIILRVSAVFSEYGHNFFKTILKLAQERTRLSIVADQVTCPTYAGHIANTVYELIAQNLKLNGTYHYCDRSPTSWYQFATAILEKAKRHPAFQTKIQTNHIKAISTTGYPTPAKRPVYSVLNCAKIQSDYQIQQENWRDTLSGILDALARP